jgi:hypothetical protein
MRASSASSPFLLRELCVQGLQRFECTVNWKKRYEWLHSIDPPAPSRWLKPPLQADYVNLQTRFNRPGRGQPISSPERGLQPPFPPRNPASNRQEEVVGWR